MIEVTFVMEQHIGHRAYYENLRNPVEKQARVRSRWVEVTYQNGGHVWERMGFIPKGIRGPVVGRSQVRQGLRKGADAIFFNTQVPAVLAGTMGKARPFIIATDITPIQYDAMGEYYGHRTNEPQLLKEYKHRRNLQVFNQAAYICPWSSWVGESLVNDYGVDERKIKVIHPGLNLKKWRADPSQKGEAVRILFVGGDFERKGGGSLLQAYQALIQRFSPEEVELVLVTRSPVEALAGVKVFSYFEPNSPELIRLYQSSDIFVLPTYAEAFGIAAVEASATGLAVIATRVGGLVDIVEDGRSGFLIDPGRLEALIEKLTFLVENQEARSQMGKIARARTEKLFDAAQNAARVVDLLQEIAG